MIALLMFLFISGGQKQATEIANCSCTSNKCSFYSNLVHKDVEIASCFLPMTSPSPKACPSGHLPQAAAGAKGGQKAPAPRQCLVQAGYNVPTIWRDCSTIVAGGDPSLHASQMDSADGSKAVKLPDDEYARLQSLRQAVVDEEKRIAVKYGAETRTVDENHLMVVPDHFEYHGQFLLIERGK